jgi:hypothetical protein
MPIRCTVCSTKIYGGGNLRRASRFGLNGHNNMEQETFG